jgi:hypothetical protein
MIPYYACKQQHYTKVVKECPIMQTVGRFQDDSATENKTILRDEILLFSL